MENSQLDRIEELAKNAMREMERIESHTRETMKASVAIATFFIYSAVVVLIAAAFAFVVGLLTGEFSVALVFGSLVQIPGQIWVITHSTKLLGKN